MKLVVKFSIKYPTEIVLPKYVIQNIPLNCDLFWFLPSSCGVVRLSILPSQGSDLGFKSRREHFIFGNIVRVLDFALFLSKNSGRESKEKKLLQCKAI